MRKVVAEMHRRPSDKNKLQRCTRAPEQRRRCQRDPPELVAPQQTVAASELTDEKQRILAWRTPLSTGVGDIPIDERSDSVAPHDDCNRRLRRRVDPGVDARNVDREQPTRDGTADQNTT